MNSGGAWDNLTAAVRRSIDHYRAMTPDDLTAAALAVAGDSGVEFAASDTLLDAMKRLAGQGSIDALAIAVAMEFDQPELADMLQAIAERSPDVIEDMKVAALSEMLGRRLEEEVAAGRMTKTLCPRTGRWLYGSKP